MEGAKADRRGERHGGAAARAKRPALILLARIAAAVVAALAAGGVAGVAVVDVFNNSSWAAQAATLSDYKPSIITRVYADDGETVIGEYAV